MKSLLPPDVLLRQIDDYLPKEEFSNTKNYKRKINFKVFIKELLSTLSISLNPDNDQNLKKIRFWTFEIRGHYSKLPINIKFLDYLIKIFSAMNVEQNELVETLTIHYRLGDLLSLPDKTYVPSKNLLIVIEDIYSKNYFNKILIFSDSIGLAKSKLQKLEKLTKNIEFSNSSTLKVMVYSLKSRYFIGTNSKVSFWIEILRQYSGKKSTILGRN